MVAGSTWPADELLLINYINNAPPILKFIIAPHEIGQSHISSLLKMIMKDSVLYSLASQNSVSEKQVMVIDNIGMLSSVYRYGRFAYIGGGFGRGIHNVLEAAVYGIPVIFGPNHHKHREAIELIEAGGGFSIGTSEEFSAVMQKLTASDEQYQNAATGARRYIQNNTGSTGKIVEHLISDLHVYK
jgi:3-deoxy-D-manno-octulosonic-acid transferase